jgi:hypothetical protein
LRRGAVVRTVVLVPGEDLLIAGDELAADWQARPGGALQTFDFGAEGPVYAGSNAVRLRAVGEETGWTLTLNPEAPVARFGYRALAFSLHPGDAVAAGGARLSVAPRPSGLIDILASGQVDLEDRRWQEVEIPLGPSGQGEALTSVLFTSNVKGTLYIDQLRLIADRVRPRPTAAQQEAPPLPASSTLEQNYPNPFNGGTTIRFNLGTGGDVDLAVYNLAGQKVAQLVRDERAADTYIVRWDGLDEAGRELASGLYLYRLRTGELEKTRKLLLLR